jgi:hypothetical protein
MKCVSLALIAVYCSLALPLSGQNKQQAGQQAGNCSINVSGNGNSASLVCKGIDPTLAKQIQTILNGTRQNESLIKEMSDKLDLIIHPTQPDVFLRFVDPTTPALVIVNPSDVVARDMKYAVELWNMDAPDRDDPLPIPTSTFDWLKQHSEGGPQNLFNLSLASSLLKNGDHLFGSATVNCPTCIRGRTYIVYIEWGKGGWVAETGDNGQLIVPINFKRETRMRYFQQLPQMIPTDKRIPIGPWPNDVDRNP